MVFAIEQAIYAYMNSFSGESLYDDFYITFYNLVFTALPLIVRAIFEQDIYYKVPLSKYEKSKYMAGYQIEDQKYLKKFFPRCYYIGQQNTILTKKSFMLWVLQGMLHGAILYALCVFILTTSVISSQGYSSDKWIFSLIINTAIIFVKLL